MNGGKAPVTDGLAMYASSWDTAHSSTIYVLCRQHNTTHYTTPRHNDDHHKRTALSEL